MKTPRKLPNLRPHVIIYAPRIRLVGPFVSDDEAATWGQGFQSGARNSHWDVIEIESALSVEIEIENPQGE